MPNVFLKYFLFLYEVYMIHLEFFYTIIEFGLQNGFVYLMCNNTTNKIIVLKISDN